MFLTWPTVFTPGVFLLSYNIIAMEPMLSPLNACLNICIKIDILFSA